MIAIVVALGLQLAWDIVRAVLEHSGIAVHEGYLFVLAIAIATATELVIAAGALDLSRRLAGARRAGARIAAFSYLAVAIATTIYLVLLYSKPPSPEVHAWIAMLRDHAWGTLEVAGIAGFALAAGGRIAWLAPPAAGCAYLTEWPGLYRGGLQQAEVIAFVVVKVVLLVVIVRGGERHATAHDPDRDGALRGLRLAELVSWIGAGLSVFWAAPSMVLGRVHLSFGLACISIAWYALLASAGWSIARSHVPGLRWLWITSATCALWAALRTLGSWGATVVWHWGHLDEVHLAMTGWWAAVPITVASLCAAIAVAVWGRRVGARPLVVTAMLAGFAEVISFALPIVVSDQWAVFATAELVAAILFVRLYRAARTTLAHPIPRAAVRTSARS